MNRNLKSIVDSKGSAIVEIVYALLWEKDLPNIFNLFSVSACYFKLNGGNYARFFCHNGNNQYKQLSSILMELDSSRIEVNEDFIDPMIEDMAPGPILFSSCKILNSPMSDIDFEILGFAKLLNNESLNALIDQL